MLDIFRKKSGNFAVYFVFAILIVVFAVGFGAVAPDQACGGGAPGTFRNRDFVEVDGQMIDAAMVRTAMQLTGDAADPKRGFVDPDDRYRYQARMVFMNLYGPFSGGLYGRDPADLSPLKLTKVVDELIETKLVAGWARSLGLGVSKTELNEALALLLSNDSFRDPKTGALEINSYRNWVSRSLETSVASFERMVEDELLRERVIQLLVGEIGASDAEIAEAWKLENDKATIEHVTIDERSAAALVPVTDAERSEWLAKNEDKVKARYDELKATKYTTPKRWTLRGIKVEAPDPSMVDDAEQKKGLEEERAAAKVRAEQILAEVKTTLSDKKVEPPAEPLPEDQPAPDFDALTAFAALASAKSDDASKAEGGLLAPATLDALGVSPYGPAVKTAVEALKPLEVSELLEVPSGFWILMPESVSEEKTVTYDEAKGEIAKSMMQQEKVADFMKGLADEVLAEAKKDPTKKLEEAAAAVNAKYGAKEGGLVASQMSFARLGRIAQGYPASSPFLMELGGRAPELVSAAFSASPEKPLLDQVFPVGDGKKLVIARFVELKPAEPVKDEDKETLRKQMSLDKRRVVYRGWYEDLLAKKRATGDIEFTSAFDEERKAAEQSFVEQGGVLPGVAPITATPAPAPTPSITVTPTPAPAP